MVNGIVSTDTTTTSHVTNRPVEELETSTVRLDNLELVNLRSKETLTPEATWIPEEVARVVTTTLNVGLKLDYPYTLSIARGTVLVVRTEQVVEHVTIFLSLTAEAALAALSLAPVAR